MVDIARLGTLMREHVVQADVALERDIFFMMRPLLMSILPSLCHPVDRSLEAFDSTSSQLVLYPKSIRRLIINSRIPSHQMKRHQTQQSHRFSKYDQPTARQNDSCNRPTHIGRTSESRDGHCIWRNSPT